MKPRPARYKAAFAMFAVALLVLSAKTVSGLGGWALDTVLPSSPGPLRTAAPTAPAVNDPVGAWPH